MSDTRLKAITIGVRHHHGLAALDFAPGLVTRVADALRKVDYEVTEVPADEITAEELGARIDEVLASCTADDLLIVHLLSHGELGDGESTVYVLGSDGIKHPVLDVDQWLKNLQLGGPRTLFLLDLCYSGTTARLPWQQRLDAERTRGWVVAACQRDQAAYDGRFSQALVAVLNGLRDNEFDVDPTVSHVPLTTVARALRQEVNRLAKAADSYGQTVTASLADISSDPDLPFFRNFGHGDDEHTRMRAGLNPGLRPFLDELDEGLDPRHFLERAAGVGQLTDQLIGCFSGRKTQLFDLSAWMVRPAEGDLCVVTGSPGVGKSALLGIMVCAAHKVLRGPTRPIWSDVESKPFQVDELAAVHARQRGVPAIVRSVANQLGLEEAGGIDDLVRHLRSSAVPPVIVIDAVDEAEDMEAVLRDFLLPIARARRADNRPVARLLAGCRPYTELVELIDLAREKGLVIDLDEVSEEVLDEDLNKYVIKLLRTVLSYKRRGGVTGAFASEVANTLAFERTGNWGPFLVAGLYTRHLVASHPDAAELTADDAAALGAAVPHTLPDVLEVDLAANIDKQHLRPVLTALAHARDQGMPITVLARVAAVFCRGPKPSLADVREALIEAKFYVRQSTDTDRTTVYRLFHQGLVDHLRQDADLLDALLEPLGPADNRDWAAAEPYVLRHVLTEAGSRVGEVLNDPGFLLLPGTAERLAATSGANENLVNLLRALGPNPTPGTLAMAAARAGSESLARRAARSLRWQPLWTVRELTDRDPETTVRYRESAVRSIAVCDDGVTVVCCYENHTVARWDVARGRETEVETTIPQPTLVAVSADGKRTAIANGARGDVQTLPGAEKAGWLTKIVAIFVEPNGRRVILMRQAGSGRISIGGAPWTAFDTRLMAAQCWAVAWGEKPILYAGVGGDVYRWVHGVDGGAQVLHKLNHVVERIVVSAAGDTIACLDRDGWVRVFRDGAWRRVAHEQDLPTALALSADGNWLAVGDQAGSVSLYYAESAASVDARPAHQAPVSCIAISSDGHTVASGAEDGSMSVWWPLGHQPAAFASQPVTACYVVPTAPQPPRWTFLAASDGVVVDNERSSAAAMQMVLIGDGGGRLGLFDLLTGWPEWMADGENGAVTNIITQDVGGRAFARLFREDGESSAWDPLTRTSVPISAWAGFGDQKQVFTASRTLSVGETVYEIYAESSGVVVLHDVVTPGESIRLPGPHDGKVTRARAGTLHGKPAVCTGGEDGTVRMWLVDRIGPPDVIEVPGAVFSLDFTDDGYLVVGAGNEVIAFHNNGDWTP